MYTSKVIQNNSFSSKIDMYYDNTLKFCVVNELIIHTGLNKIIMLNKAHLKQVNDFKMAVKIAQ